MQHALLNHATFQVADTTGVSGRVTAKYVKRGFCAKKQSDLSRICVLAIFGSVVFLAPVSARAQGVPAEIAALKAQVAALQSQVQALQTQLAAVQSNNALKLGPFVNVDPNPENGVIGPNIKFTGANIHILSGSGATNDNGTRSGLGNLIIGYDEFPFGGVADRSGSHNLVIGRFHTFTSSAWGGLVAGETNTIGFAEASVSGGLGKTADGFGASVSGGIDNIAGGAGASVSGGLLNNASWTGASVSGGSENRSMGQNTSVSGGNRNVAAGPNSSVTGGRGNTAGRFDTPITSGFYTVVIGGQNVTDFNDFSIAPQPPFP